MAGYDAAAEGDVQLLEYDERLRGDGDVNHQVLLTTRNSTTLRDVPQLDFYITYSYSLRDTAGQLYTFGAAPTLLCRPAPTSVHGGGGGAAATNCSLRVFVTRAWTGFTRGSGCASLGGTPRRRVCYRALLTSV